MTVRTKASRTTQALRVSPCNQVMRTGEGVSQGLGAAGVVDAEATSDVDDSGVET